MAISEVEYEWVADYARQQIVDMNDQRKGLDEKAGSIITYLSSGAGLTLLGTTMAITEGKVDRWVAVSLLPAVAAALLSIYLAMLGRKARRFSAMPAVGHVILHAEYYVTEKAAKKAHLNKYAEIVVKNLPLLQAKAWDINAAIWCFLASVVLLLLPFAVAILKASEVAAK